MWSIPLLCHQSRWSNFTFMSSVLVVCLLPYKLLHYWCITLCFDERFIFLIRFYPVGLEVQRYCQADMVIGGYQVPKGVTLLFYIKQSLINNFCAGHGWGGVTGIPFMTFSLSIWDVIALLVMVNQPNQAIELATYVWFALHAWINKSDKCSHIDKATS